MKLEPEQEKMGAARIIAMFMLIGVIVILVKMGIDANEEITTETPEKVTIEHVTDTVYMHDTTYVTKYIQQQETGQDGLDSDIPDAATTEEF